MDDQDVIMKESLPHQPLYDPLHFDLDYALGQLRSAYTTTTTDGLLHSIDFTLIQSYLDAPSSVNKIRLLDTVARCLLYHPWTLKIIDWFRPIAIDLVSRLATPGFLDFLQPPSHSTITVYKLELVARTFALTLPTVPQVKSLVVSYFSHSPSLFERLTQLSQDYSTLISASDVTQLHELLFTAYKLLKFSTTSFAPLWNWGPLVQLLHHPRETVRYLTTLCLSKVYGLNDAQTKHLLDAVVGLSNDQSEDPLMVVLDGNRIDLRLLSLWEEQCLADAQITLMTNTSYSSQSTPQLTSDDLCSFTTNLCGVLMAKPIHATSTHSTHTVSKEPQLITTETTAKNLHAVALALSIGAPTLLEGVTGAGKTTLVEELAIRTGRGDQLVKIHLGDQTDPKVLLGTYVSTSTPGSFRWQAGVLTTAVQEGRWVLIEDIDLAPAEVISVLLPLLETRHLFIPSRGEEIKAKEGFHLFGTRSLIPSRSGKSFSSRGGELVTGANLWTRVHVDALSMQELEIVVREKFQHIGDFSRHVMELFQTVVNVYQDPNFTSLSSSSVGRFISTRDLMKWCYRIDTLLGARLGGNNNGLGQDESIRQDLFSEAIDCFCGMISDYATWVVVLEKLGEPLQISQAMVRHYVDQYKPAFDVSGANVRVGRVNLSSIAANGRQKQKEAMVKREKKRPFATTGHALRLLEKIAVSVHLVEPVLLVGETGTGKTTVVQHLADMMHQNLVVVNLSQQSDSSDLLGGFKPVDGKVLAIPLREEFERLFEKTFSVKKNAKFLDVVRKAFIHQKWTNFVALMKQSIKMSQQKFQAEDDQQNSDATITKRISSPQLRQAWKSFGNNLEAFEVQQVQSQNKFVFSFMEGSLVKAVRQGDWILMDEINLATTETLECLSGLLEDAEGSLVLTEKGDIEPIKRHPNFRLFACMNPATDVGKRDLPPGLRNRFTEFYVHSPDSRYEDLLQIVRQYILPVATGDERACDDVAQFYMEAKKLSQQHKLVDGANQRPHFSIRTLARALTYVLQIYSTYGLRRSLYEGFCMTFLTQLNKESESLMQKLILKTILSNVTSTNHLITQIPRQPADNFIQFGYFWLEQGQFDPVDDPHYIMTPSVETKLYNLARVIMSRKFPVLIQGPTSAGKTSMIEYLAKKTGHRFVRINNHEHTDLQEYLGTYVSNSDGKLVFQEGVLVEALRNGYWIVLDELNLAPSDVLEALNRLLDDNRELLIPETQEVVKPHPHFMLFATQNPAGLYGGRKALSRAFRNRFLELHFDDIPEEELETILSQRCQIAPSYCKRLVQVYQSLMERRQSTRIFEQRHGFITLRDLFRWAGRDPDGYQELAEHGYMLLAERCRRDEEKRVVKDVLETVMRVKLNENDIYDTSKLEEFAIYDKMLQAHATQTGQDTALVWTKAMKRLFTLVARCLQFNEPVLLVGDTGCGKTTVCQMLAETYARELHIVNCHQNTETGDLLGGQRPVRQSEGAMDEADSDQPKPLFEWHDGPLVQSMREGHLFLLDEISLADDSVLERLNSVLEPSRLLVLAEKGGKHVEELHGAASFQFLATMNPGGDYGKKELSPALRNRFTEIWVPAVTDRDDLLNIISEQISHPQLKEGDYAAKMLDFIGWYMKALGQSRAVVSLRDILSWVKFMNTGAETGLDPQLCYVHGACIVLLDGLGSHGSSGSFLVGDSLKEFRLKCLRQLVNDSSATEKSVLGLQTGGDKGAVVSITDDHFAIGPFQISRGQLDKADIKFTLLAPTTGDNAMRVIRSMQLKKPILLEGSPGVGKTSLVSALAAASGHHLVRINLSEQTDLMDLFGSDLPVEGGNSGEFAWRDAPFLQAMKAGDWVLLDELNLASQSVLEGLNSCLDHRGAVYIPELDREFFCAPGFRVFGAQNPLQQGGGRKGLPKSFVNRFTQVYVEQLTADDLLFICTHLFPEFEPDTLQRMITFNTTMYHETMVRCSFGRKGSPWEFNLRDVFRWLELMQSNKVTDPMEFLGIIYLQRMRTDEDRLKVVALYESVFDCKYNRPDHPHYTLTPDHLVIGHSSLPRTRCTDDTLDAFEHQDHILQSFLSPMEALIKCVESSWMAIVTGPSASGKTSLVRLLSKMTGNKLEEFAMNNSVDTMELLGGFEQVDLNRHRQVIIDTLRGLTNRATKTLLGQLSSSTDGGQKQTVLTQIRQLSDAWFALGKQQHLRQESEHHANDSLNYALVSAVLNGVNISSDMESEISAVVDSVKRLQLLEKNSVAGKFEWIDGLLINALENGHWLLIDNANLCNPSVLDRLNPLFENNGVLMVNERGLVDGTVKVITPHPNFRMFMTVDPQNGELSRAMRNRGIEIALVNSHWNTTNAQDVTKLTNSLGLRGARLPVVLNQLQQEAAAKRKHFGKSMNVRDYLLMASYIVERLQRGQILKEAVRESFYQVFVDIKNDDVPEALAAFMDTTNEELIQSMISPTNCPLLIGGNLGREDSRLAMVALQGAYLLSLLQQQQQPIDGDDDDERRMKQHLCRIDIAGDLFLESMNAEDYGIRRRWLAFVSQRYDLVLPQSLERLGYLVQTYRSHTLFSEQATGQQSRQAYLLFIRLCKQEYAMKAIRNSSQRLKVASLTVIQQSFCLQEGRISASQLLHPVVAELYPFFAHVNEALLQWVDHKGYEGATDEIFDSIGKILDLYDFAWEMTQSDHLPLDNLLIVLRSVKGLMLMDLFSGSTLFAGACDGIDRIMSAFDFETSRSMKELWKYFGPATLASETLYALEVELLEINGRLNAYQHAQNDHKLTETHLILKTSTELKETLIEGIATLYAVDENNDKDAKKLAKSLKQLPAFIRDQLPSIPDPTTAITTMDEDRFDENGGSWDTAMMPLYDYTSVVKEMDLLSKLYLDVCQSKSPATLLEKLKAFRAFTLEKSSRPPLDVVPYQRLIWLLDSDDSQKIQVGLAGLIQDAVHQWQQRLWRSSVYQTNLYHLTSKEKTLVISGGSLNLFESVESLACLNMLSSVDSIGTDKLDTALKQLKNLKSFLASHVNTMDRLSVELVMLISMACQLFTASSSTVICSEVHTAISSELATVLLFTNSLSQQDAYSSSPATHDGAIQACSALERLVNQLKEHNFNDYFILALASLSDAIQHYDGYKETLFFTSAGKARTLLGLSFVACYVPDYPADPTAEPRLHVDLLTRKKQQHTNIIDTQHTIESIITGNATNDTIELEKTKLASVDGQLATTLTTFSLRPKHSQLDDIFVDLRYLQSSMLDKNVESLVRDLEHMGKETVIQREQLLQGNALQFIDRIQAKYPLYRDILQPLLVAVDDIKYGLRLMTALHRRDPMDAFLAQVIQLLIRNPDASTHPQDLDWHTLASPARLEAVKTVIFERAPTNRKWAFYLRLLIVVLQHLVIGIYNGGYIQTGDLDSLNVVFSEIVYIWKSAQEYKRQKDAEKEQLYKTRAKKYETATDEELEEMDMKKVFADFNEDFADLTLDDSNDNKTSAPPTDVEEESVLDAKDIQQIGHLHRTLFDDFQHNLVSRQETKNWNREILQSYSIAGQLSNLATSAFGYSADRVCHAGHLRVTDIAIRRLESNDSFSMTSNDIYDFYTCENVAEAKKVEPVLRRFRTRVSAILSEWPEHAVLQQLVAICDRVLGFSITAPVAKFLTGVELLLQKSEDWEAYAAKHVSIKTERDELITMIIQWRQLELNCWPKLLAVQEQNCQDSVYNWWFHLYDAVNNSDFADRDQVKKNTTELLSALDQFMQSSSLIEFEPRLKMIDSFYRQTLLQAQMTSDDDERKTYLKVSTLLRNSYLYYAQFKDHSQVMLKQLRKPIEKDLKDFVKIATWKDVNIYALKQSASKTHRQLHKCIRKYRDVLNNSMLTVIANYNEERAMFQYGDEKRYNDVNKGFLDQLGQSRFWITSTVAVSPAIESGYEYHHDDAAPEIKRHLLNLDNTLTRMQDVCRNFILVAPTSTQEQLPLESFMSEIIGQIKHFQKETPAVMTDENKSMVKNQKLLKKKAMVDFLKELKRLGLKWRTSGTLVQQNADTSILFNDATAALEKVLVEGAHLVTPRLSSFCGLSQDLMGVWTKANDYYFRCIARLTHLRSISTTQVSKDLSMLEVERSMAATEHMFHLVTKERSILTRFEETMRTLQGASVQLATLFSNDDGVVLSSDAGLGGRLTRHKMYVDQITFMLQQALTTMKLQGNTQGPLDEVHGLWNTLIKLQQHTDHLFSQRYLYPQASTGVVVLSDDVAVGLDQDLDSLSSVSVSLLEIMQDNQQFCHVLYPIMNHINNYVHQQQQQRVDGSIDNMDGDAGMVVELRDKSYSLVDAILVAVQDLKKAKTIDTDMKTDDDVEQDDMADNYIKSTHTQQFTLTNALHLEVLTKRCVGLLSAAQALCAHSSSDCLRLEIKSRLQQVYPFLQQYMWLTQHTLGEILVHHKSLAKMTYCLTNSFAIIISKGFCMPEGASDEEEGEADGTATGTGMGEGEGNKDVSEQIEDEEQVLGLQNDEQQKDDDNKPETKEEKNGMDMENDFDGQLEDMEPNEDEDSDSDSDSDDEDPDEQIGDVDDMDPDAVDDKMWGDEAEENLKESDKTVDDQGQGQQDQKDTDIVAQEEDQDGAAPPKKQQQPGDKADDTSDQKDDDEMADQNEEGGGDDGDDDDGEEEGAGEDEDAVENQAGDKMNADIPEAETLELPDDMDMGGEEGGDQEEEDGMNDDGGDDFQDSMDVDEQTADAQKEEGDGDEDQPFQDPLDNLPQEAVDDDNQRQDDEEGDGDQDMDDATAQVKDEGEEPEQQEEADEENAANTGDMEQQQQGMTIEEEEDEDQQQDTKGQNREQPNSEAIADNQFGVQGESGKSSSSSSGQKHGEDDNDGDNDDDQQPDDAKQPPNKGVADRGSNNQTQQEEDADQPTEDDEKKNSAKTNPQRSLGDALESWRRRLGDVIDQEDDEDEDADANEDEAGKDDATDVKVNEDNAFEYVRNDDDAHDMQTMGNATADQLQDQKLGALDDAQMADDDDQQPLAGEEVADEDETMADSTIDTMPLPKESLDQPSHGDSSDQRGGVVTGKQVSSIDRDEEEKHGLTVDESVIARDPLDQQDIERMREELETKVSEWREQGRDDGQKARDLWQGYENLTHDLAMGLCEQLRLILEPTLATKLKGDYRTGKRLNMKKIIPYIASQFKKDKIWLRRTKPSKRQYQVMISVDDSKSMSESHSVQLAYETLSLISKAMSQLEVGDLCITSFGERIRLLHPFDQPFTSESGANVLQQFTFAQQKTYVKNLVESSLGLFENAQGGAQHNSELWQLQLIISDGICEDHETLRALVRRAMDERVMIIFIVVDNKPEKDSILNMTNVKYATVNGKLSLQMAPYLETFPFQYFMVLRDINSLPEALSDALRQYFSFVAA